MSQDSYIFFLASHSACCAGVYVVGHVVGHLRPELTLNELKSVCFSVQQAETTPALLTLFTPHTDTATHCSVLQCVKRPLSLTLLAPKIVTSIHCNTLQHTATRCSTLQHTAAHCNTLQDTAIHCITLQYTAVWETTSLSDLVRAKNRWYLCGQRRRLHYGCASFGWCTTQVFLFHNFSRNLDCWAALIPA